jgi:hypothetical protein
MCAFSRQTRVGRNKQQECARWVRRSALCLCGPIDNKCDLRGNGQAHPYPADRYQAAAILSDLASEVLTDHGPNVGGCEEIGNGH